ncbi:MAG: hypothetical protein U1E65_06060 [Myxococcota bacterium]
MRRLLLLLACWCGGACARGAVELSLPDAQISEGLDAATVDAASTDADSSPDASTGPDRAAADDGGVVGPPPRRLQSRALLGDLPVENRVHNAVFDLATASWGAYARDPAATAQPSLLRAYLEQAPVVAPALRVEKSGQAGAIIVGSIRGLGRPLEVSVLLGQPLSAAAPPHAALLGMSAEGLVVAYDLLPGQAPPIERGELRWTKVSVRVEAPTVGWLTLLVDDPSAETSWLQAPIALPAPPERSLKAPAEPRAPTALEEGASRAYAKARQRLAGFSWRDTLRSGPPGPLPRPEAEPPQSEPPPPTRPRAARRDR